MIGLIDIGGTKLLAAVARADEPPGPSVRRATPRTAPLATLYAMLDEARAGAPLEAIGLAVPGPFDRERGALINPPGQPPAWHGLALREQLGRRYGCPVLLENDANCAALAEARFGAGRGYRTVVHYTVSTGIGSGMVRDGQLIFGRHDTEGGHQVLWPGFLGGPPCDCGGAGCLEALASGRAFARRFGRRADELDDPVAWAEIGRWLGLAVVNTTALIDPDAVIFGGGVCAAWERFAPALHATGREALHFQPAPHIARTQLGADRNLWGALALVIASPPG